MGVAIKIKRAIQKHDTQTNVQRQVWIAQAFGMKYSTHYLVAQVPPRQGNAAHGDRSVVPLQTKLLPIHEPGRDEDAQRHGHQQQGTEERHHGRGPVESDPGVQAIVESVSRPTQLPGAKILMAALLVEVSEQKEEQQGDEPRDDDHADRDTVHSAGNTSAADYNRPTCKESEIPMFSHHSRQNNIIFRWA